MATPKVGFFNPSADDLPSWATTGGWLIQTEENETVRERAQALDANGNEAAHALYGAKTTRTLTLTCCSSAGSLTLPAIGSLIDASGKAWHVDSFTLEKSPTAWPSLTLVLHAHDSRKHTACRTFTPSLTLAAGRGIPRNVGGFSLSDLGIGFAAFTYRCETNHVDATDGDGEFLAADNYDGTETVTLRTTGEGPVTTPAGWGETHASQSRANTSHDATEHTYTRHTAMTGAA